MNQAQATDALIDTVCRADLRCSMARHRSERIVSTAMKYVPNREWMVSIGERAAKQELKTLIIGDLIAAGIIVLLFTVVPALAWSVLVSVIAGLLIHWILTDRAENKLIRQARGWT